MQKQLQINNKTICYTVKRSTRARALRISVNDRGEVLATLPWFGRLSQLEKFIKSRAPWILKTVERTLNQPKSILQKGTRKDYLKNRELTRRLVLEKLEYFNQWYNFKYKRIAIRDQKSRWGSCSSLGNLNFNWRVVLLYQIKESYLDYIVVHELCHLGQMNHSAAFWKLVEKTIPDYKLLRKEIRNL